MNIAPPMRNRTTRQFRDALAQLPAQAQRLAADNFKAWAAAPYHPRFDFHPLDLAPGCWRVRVGRDYRAIARRVGPASFLWVWIGTHEAYNKRIKSL